MIGDPGVDEHDRLAVAVVDHEQPSAGDVDEALHPTRVAGLSSGELGRAGGTATTDEAAGGSV